MVNKCDKKNFSIYAFVTLLKNDRANAQYLSLFGELLNKWMDCSTEIILNKSSKNINNKWYICKPCLSFNKREIRTLENRMMKKFLGKGIGDKNMKDKSAC